MEPTAATPTLSNGQTARRLPAFAHPMAFAKMAALGRWGRRLALFLFLGLLEAAPALAQTGMGPGANGQPHMGQMGGGHHWMGMMAQPDTAYLLLMLGILGLYIELSNPGMILPGVLGLLFLTMAFIALFSLPVNLGSLGLIALGVALLAAEPFVPSFGLLGVAGMVALFFGSINLINTDEGMAGVNPWLVAGSMLGLAGVMLLIGRALLKSYRLPPVSSQQALVGQAAEVVQPIAPGKPGKIFIHGEYWRAESDQTLEAGQKARVTAVEGLVLKVAPW